MKENKNDWVGIAIICLGVGIIAGAIFQHQNCDKRVKSYEDYIEVQADVIEDLEGLLDSVIIANER